MPKFDQNRQLGKQRANWELALRRSKCPKDGSHVLESAQPDVVCPKCGTMYVLATREGLLTLRHELIEKSPSTAPVLSQPRGSPNLARFCHKCGSPLKPEAMFCSSCGTEV